MSFRDLFEAMRAQEPAIRAGALAGGDGLAVEEWRAPGAADDLAALSAELVQVFRESARISGENGLGAAGEVTVAGERGHLFIRPVTEEYYLLVVADPAAIPGRCRFLLRRGAQRARGLL